VHRSTSRRFPLPLLARDPKSIVEIPEVAQLTTLSRDTLDRRYGKKYRRLSPNRVGLSVEDVLEILKGCAPDGG
jgi:hypothetical protein